MAAPRTEGRKQERGGVLLKFRPFSIYYTTVGDKLVVHLCGRDEDGNRHEKKVYGTKPYFYSNEIPSHHLVTDVKKNAARSLKGHTVHKIFTEFPYHVPQVRKQCDKTWEADVYFANRVRYDLGIKDVIEIPDRGSLSTDDIQPLSTDEGPEISPRVCVFDIEVNSKKGFHSPDSPGGEVISIAAWDSKSDAYVCLLNGTLNKASRRKAMRKFKQEEWSVQIVECSNERELFSRWKQFLGTSSPDVLAGWNSSDMPGKHAGDGYDVPYLKNRADLMGFPEPDYRKFAEFDLMDGYKGQHRGKLESKSLEFVSKEEGLEGKSTDESVWELYERDRGNLLIYNVTDVYLTKEIMERSGVLSFYLELAKYAGINVQDTVAAGSVVDGYTFHRLAGENIVQPTTEASDGFDLAGGHVEEASEGLFRNVVEVDLSSQYPNAMRTFNLSPDTKVDEEFSGPVFEMPSGAKYRKDKAGVIPEILDDIIKLREEKRSAGKDREQAVIKALANSYFGNLGSRYYRNQDTDISNDITASSRDLIRWIWNYVQENDDRPLYTDTDSVLFIFGDGPEEYTETERLAEEAVQEMNDALPEFASRYGWEDGDPMHLEIEVEHVYEYFFQPGVKKKYVAAYRDPHGDIERDGYRYSMKVRGFETRRSNAATLTKQLQRDILEDLLFGASPDDIADQIRDVVKQMKDGKIPPEDIYVPMGIGKENYKQTPQHVRAAEWSNQHLGKNFKVGDTPHIVFGEIDGKPRTDVFALEWGDDLPEGTTIDWDATVKRIILGPLKRILDALGLDDRDILRPTEDVGGFF